jgi:polyhydroxybutyrate depolymerase
VTCYCSDSLSGAAGRTTTFGGAYLPGGAVTIQYPNAFQGNRTYPLLLTLHGYGQTGASGLSTLNMADAKDWGSGMIVASPNGKLDSTSNRYWNATAAFLDKDGTNQDDQGPLHQLLLDIIAAWPIDTRYVIVAGYSTGGSMAHMLARAYADLVTHVVSLSGVGPLAGDPRIHTPSRAVNVVHVHGSSDVTVGYNGHPPDAAGAGLANYPGAVTTCDDWKALNGNTGSLATYDSVDLETTIVGSETDRQRYTTAPANGLIEHWKVNSANHTMSLNHANWVKLLYDWLTVTAGPRV